MQLEIKLQCSFDSFKKNQQRWEAVNLGNEQKGRSGPGRRKKYDLFEIPRKQTDL